MKWYVWREEHRKKDYEFQKEFNKSSCLVWFQYWRDGLFFFFRFFNSLNPDIQSFFLKLVSKFKKKKKTTWISKHLSRVRSHLLSLFFFLLIALLVTHYCYRTLPIYLVFQSIFAVIFVIQLRTPTLHKPRGC